MVGRGHATRLDTLNRALREVLSKSGHNPDAAFPGFRGPVFNPMAFLAVGDGIANDTTPVNDAIAAVQLAGGGVVHIPHGKRFRVAATLAIPSNVTVQGDGPGSVLYFDWTLASDPKGSVYIRNADNVAGNTKLRLENLTIEGAGDGTPAGNSPVPVSGLLLRLGSDYSVRGVRFYRIPGIAFSFQGVRGITIAGNHVKECGRDGITGYWYNGVNCTDVSIVNNNIDTVGDDAIAVHSLNGVSVATARPRNITIVGNTIRGHDAAATNLFGRGICITGCEDFIVAHNTIDSTCWDGILIQHDPTASLTSRYGLVQGNTVRNAGQVGDATNPRNGIRVIGASNVRVKDNMVNGSKENGIFFGGSATYSVVNSRIEDNDVDSCGTTAGVHFGIFLDGNSANIAVNRVRVRGNSVTNCISGGIRVWYADRCRVENNDCLSNGTGHATSNTDVTAAGIYVEIGGRDITLQDNWSTDLNAGGSKKQSYGLYVGNAGSTRLRDIMNDWEGNVGTDGFGSSATMSNLTSISSQRGSGYSDRRRNGQQTLSVSANYSLTLFDDLVLVDATAGAVTITMPSAATTSGRVYTIKKVDASANAVTLNGATIDGVANPTLTTQWQSKRVQASGAGTTWYNV